MAFGRVLPVACWLGLGIAACGLDFDRYDPDSGAAGPLDASLDASGDGDGGVTEAATTDAPGSDGDTGATDAAKEAASACKPAAGVLVAPQAGGAITVDGDLGDWGTPLFTLLAASDAALIMGPNGTCTAANATSQCLVPNGETAEVALLHDAASLYVGVRVTAPGVGGGSTTAPYTNDAVELYLRADPAPTGDYTGVDHQYVVDWKNEALDYGASQNGTGQPNPPGFSSAVKVANPGNGGYVVEAKIALSALGQTSLAPGQTLGFDLGVDHGQGTPATRSFLVWWMASHAPPTCSTAKCTGCSPEQPYCDTLDFGLVCAE
jgi:hypothetical protein